MIRKRTRRIVGLLCVLVMAGVAIWALWRFGWTPLSTLFLIVAVGCVGAAAYAWWTSERVLRDIERVRSQLLKTVIEKGKHREP